MSLDNFKGILLKSRNEQKLYIIPEGMKIDGFFKTGKKVWQDNALDPNSVQLEGLTLCRSRGSW